MYEVGRLSMEYRRGIARMTLAFGSKQVTADMISMEKISLLYLKW